MTVSNELIDSLLAGYKKPEDLIGEHGLLGLWIAQTEGVKFWPQVVTELKNRGVRDIFIACVDGLKGLPEAIVYPKTAVQPCIVHLVRHSLNYVGWRLRKAVGRRSALPPLWRGPRPGWRNSRRNRGPTIRLSPIVYRAVLAA